MGGAGPAQIMDMPVGQGMRLSVEELVKRLGDGFADLVIQPALELRSSRGRLVAPDSAGEDVLEQLAFHLQLRSAVDQALGEGRERDGVGP